LEDKAAQGFLVSDELWERIKPLLPEHKNAHRFGGGRPRKDDRTCLDGILFVLRTGCQWKALSATGICPSSTAHDRFQEWVRAGVFLKFWTAGLMAYDALKGIDWAWLSMDGVMTKAPLGGKKIGAEPHGPRQERRQTLAADRGRGRAGRAGGGRGQPPRHEADAPDDPEHPGRPPRADEAQEAGHVPGQGLRL
jgi:transposase